MRDVDKMLDIKKIESQDLCRVQEARPYTLNSGFPGVISFQSQE